MKPAASRLVLVGANRLLQRLYASTRQFVIILCDYMHPEKFAKAVIPRCNLYSYIDSQQICPDLSCDAHIEKFEIVDDSLAQYLSRIYSKESMLKLLEHFEPDLVRLYISLHASSLSSHIPCHLPP